MQAFENLVEMGNRLQVEVADKIIVTGDLEAGHALRDVLDQFFDEGELAWQALDAHDRLNRIAQRSSIKINREAPYGAAVFQSFQAFTTARCGEPYFSRESSYGNPGVVVKPADQAAVDVVEEQPGGSKDFHTTGLT